MVVAAEPRRHGSATYAALATSRATSAVAWQQGPAGCGAQRRSERAGQLPARRRPPHTVSVRACVEIAAAEFVCYLLRVATL